MADGLQISRSVVKADARSAWVGVLLCLLAFVAPVCGQADDADVLGRLGGEAYDVRQAATRELLADNELTQEDLDRLYIASETPEQRHRLLRVARHHMIRRMIEQQFGEMVGPGSMGLSHHTVRVTAPDQETERTGVMVVVTLPGFPAYALLEPGDVIVSFAGQPIPQRMSPTQFQNLILTHQAGERIELELMRNGRPMTVLFMLCQGQALSEVYNTNEITLNEPYLGLWAELRMRMQALPAGPEPAAADQ